VERETAVARMRVEDAEIAIKQEQDDMRNAEMAGLTATTPETTFDEMLNAIGDSLSDLARSDDGEDGEDKAGDEEDHPGGRLSEDDQPGWVMGTISNTVKHSMECFRNKQIKLDELTQLGWGDAADYFRGKDKKYVCTESKFPAVVQPETADDAASSVLTTFSEPLGTLDSVPGKLQMPQVTSRPGSSHMSLSSGNLQTHEHIMSLPPAQMPNRSQIQQSNPVEPLSFNSCILRPKLFTI